MKRKIFVSVNLSDRDKKRLFFATEKWRNLPVKWVRKENLHATILFLGYLDDDTVAEVCRNLKEAVSEEESFDLVFKKIEISPSSGDPRVIWLSGAPSPELLVLGEKMEKALGIFVSSKKSFRPHITLGRIRKAKWEALPKKPEISEKFSLVAGVDSIDVMSSHFEGGGSVFTLVEKCQLK